MLLSFDWSSYIIIKHEISTLLSFVISAGLALLYFKNSEKGLKGIAKDFNSLMSEWQISSFLRQPVKFDIIDSNIVLGNLSDGKIIYLYIHTGCKYCPDALRELMNLILIDDRYCVNLFIRSNSRVIDYYYFNEIKLAAGTKRYEDIYKIYLAWKNDVTQDNKKVEESSEFNVHREILSNSKVESYPTIILDKYKLSIFNRYDNIKIALINS